MDELVQFCLKELAFDGDLGASQIYELYSVDIAFGSNWAWGSIPACVNSILTFIVAFLFIAYMHKSNHMSFQVVTLAACVIL